MTTIAYLQKSTNPTKKYMITINGKTIHFGAEGYSDYTKHKNDSRKKLYDIRHKSRENWTKTGIKTAGFWSKWILWSKKTLQESISYIYDKFKIKINIKSPTKSKRKSPTKYRSKSPTKYRSKSPTKSKRKSQTKYRIKSNKKI